MHFSNEHYLIADVQFTDLPASTGGETVAIGLQLRAMPHVTDVTGRCKVGRMPSARSCALRMDGLSQELQQRLAYNYVRCRA